MIFELHCPADRNGHAESLRRMRLPSVYAAAAIARSGESQLTPNTLGSSDDTLARINAAIAESDDTTHGPEYSWLASTTRSAAQVSHIPLDADDSFFRA